MRQGVVDPRGDRVDLEHLGPVRGVRAEVGAQGRVDTLAIGFHHGFEFFEASAPLGEGGLPVGGKGLLLRVEGRAELPDGLRGAVRGRGGPRAGFRFRLFRFQDRHGGSLARGPSKGSRGSRASES